MDEGQTRKPKWPLDVHEAISAIERRALPILDNCAKKGEPLGLNLDFDEIEEVLKACALELFKVKAAFCAAQPGFRLEWLDEALHEPLVATFKVTPLPIMMRSRFSERWPKMREAIEGELRSVIEKGSYRAAKGIAQQAEPGPEVELSVDGQAISKTEAHSGGLPFVSEISGGVRVPAPFFGEGGVGGSSVFGVSGEWLGKGPARHGISETRPVLVRCLSGASPVLF